MPFYTDPIDTTPTGLFAKPRVLQPDPSPVATGRCPQCRYLVVLPCEVCEQQPAITHIVTAHLLAHELAPSAPLDSKKQAILDLAVAWVRLHPQRELTAQAIDHDPHFPFQRQYVYNTFGRVTLLNRMAREIAFPGSDHLKMYART